jgi:hypothetical protein
LRDQRRGSADVGELLGLRAEERKRYRLTTMWPIDGPTKAEAKAIPAHGPGALYCE